MEKRDIFIGGAWPYSNYYLHIGHLAALLPGDILAKYYRGNGDNVIYVSGSDCHGTPITERAKKEKTTPEEIAHHYHEEFTKTFKNVGFEYDMYASTMEEFHSDYVQDKFLLLMKNGYIYEKEEKQDFCKHCNKFLSDREIVGICPHCNSECSGDQCDNCLSSLDTSEVLNKKCKECSNPTIMKDNKHLYFALTKFENVLQKLIEDRRETWRRNALGEAQKYIDMGLVDRATTRQLEWGIKVPVEGYEDKRIYVWIEAVLGYLSVGNEVAKKRGINFDEFLSNDNKNLRTYFVHGKDNIPFHTTIFPALLEGFKMNYRLPDYIISSAYVNLNDEKMSKSKGNLITVNELLDKFPRDSIRFYFTYFGPETHDTNCSIDDMVQVHNKFLVGVLGNFVNRNLSFINKKFDGKITEGIVDKEVIDLTVKTYNEAGLQIEKGEFRNALNTIMDYVSYGNKYYDEHEPWIKVKEDIDAFNNITYTCTYMMANIANLIYPFMKDTSLSIKEMLNLKDYKWECENINGNINIKDLKLLFERIEQQ